MKLLEDVPSAVTHRPPPRRTRLTLGAAAAFLLVAAAVGVFLIVTGGSSDESAPDAGPRPSGTLADWAAGVTDACTMVAAERPIMAEGPEARLDPANLGAVDVGTSALIASVRRVPLPVDELEREQASGVVALGDQVSQAWSQLAGAAEVTAEQLAEANALTTGFVAGATELGASCAPIS